MATTHKTHRLPVSRVRLGGSKHSLRCAAVAVTISGASSSSRPTLCPHWTLAAPPPAPAPPPTSGLRDPDSLGTPREWDAPPALFPFRSNFALPAPVPLTPPTPALTPGARRGPRGPPAQGGAGGHSCRSAPLPAATGRGGWSRKLRLPGAFPRDRLRRLSRAGEGTHRDPRPRPLAGPPLLPSARWLGSPNRSPVVGSCPPDSRPRLGPTPAPAPR